MRAWAAGLLMVAALACGGHRGPGGPAPTVSPTPGLVAADLKYRLIAGLGHVAYCDPDLYPLGRPVTDADISQRLATAQTRDPTTYAAVLRHSGWAATGLTATERRAIYQDLKELQALQLTPAGDGYRFSYTVAALAGRGGGVTRVDGAIDGTGRISVASRSPNTVMCPI